MPLIISGTKGRNEICQARHGIQTHAIVVQSSMSKSPIPPLKCTPPFQNSILGLLEKLPGCRIYGLGDVEWQMGVIPSVWMGIWGRSTSGAEASANILVARALPWALPLRDDWELDVLPTRPKIHRFLGRDMVMRDQTCISLLLAWYSSNTLASGGCL